MRHTAIDVIVSAKQYPDLFESFKNRDPVAPLKYLLTTLINEGLGARSPGGTRYGTMSREMFWNIPENKAESKIRPDSLLAAIWLQVADAVETDVEFKTCKNCGLLFALTRTTNRRSRLHCSDACKTYACRRRAIEAIRLHANGMTCEDIAIMLGSQLETVKGWVAKRRKG